MVTRRVLVTGISGFVGAYLARQLLELENEVTCLLPRRANGHKPKRLEEMNILSSINILNGDITDLTSILSAIQYCEPDWIFHLAAQSYIPQSFKDPLETFRVNCLGTQNILEAARLKGSKSRLIFAGSSEEYGLQFKDINHYQEMRKKYGAIQPEPRAFPELPINEGGYLRPMSPYATSKVYGDYAFRNYHSTFNLDTIVSRAFNHEGAGRGHDFVTSTIVRQLVSMHIDKENVMKIGDIQSFRDWSHVEDIVDGYILLAEKADAGDLYVQGSMRSNSVLSYVLYTMASLGYNIQEISTMKGEKKIKDPLDKATVKIGNTTLNSNVADQMLLSNRLAYNLADQGLVIKTDKRNFNVQFEPSRFRPSDVPILLSNIEKIKRLGFEPKKGIVDIINDQINYYLDPNHRHNVMSE